MNIIFWIIENQSIDCIINNAVINHNIYFKNHL